MSQVDSCIEHGGKRNVTKQANNANHKQGEEGNTWYWDAGDSPAQLQWT